MKVSWSTEEGMLALMVNTGDVWFGFRVWNWVAYWEKS